ncbi:MAG: UbiH/UbiF/VisC/COQ6 family ubiquinone biosynthesis hydroxylase [Rhodospirillaceae bacterium]|nr:UbiH/UbiF/VisC/COQ6 family ubiquinone biosynthesis hydroxylase [Rhodospirillaceae bacterium]
MTSAAPKTDICVDVAIAGAGLIGGTLAVALARHGIKTAVIDRLDPAAMLEGSFDGRASAITASSQTLLAAIGLWPHLADVAEPIREIRVSDGAAPLFLHYDHALLGDTPLGFMAENRHYRLAVARAMAELPGHLTVVSGRAVTGMSDGPDQISLALDDGQQVRARLAVAAEGRDSKLRELAGIGLTGWSYSQTAIVATIGHARPHDGIAHERFLPAGPFAILPLPDDRGVHRSSLVWTERTDAAPGYLALDGTRFLAEIAERVGGFLGELSLIGPRFSYPLGLQFAARYGRGRMVLAGDAAHGIHPIAGQGLNLGLRDVAALTEIIADAHGLGLDLAHPEGLARYERWRRADNLMMAGVTDVLNRLFSNDIAPVRLARDLGLAAINRIVPLKKFFMRHAMGTVGDLPRLMRAPRTGTARG